MQRNLSLFSQNHLKKAMKEYHETEHGGDLGLGKRKQARPFSPKAAIHVVLRSSQACGKRSFLAKENRSWISQETQRIARLFHIRLYQEANSGNHIHLILRSKRKEAFQSFLRLLTGSIAMKIMRARKGSPNAVKFWNSIPYTRLVHWGREYMTLRQYLLLNHLEGLGALSRYDQDAKQKLGKWKRSWAWEFQ